MEDEKETRPKAYSAAQWVVYASLAMTMVLWLSQNVGWLKPVAIPVSLAMIAMAFSGAYLTFWNLVLGKSPAFWTLLPQVAVLVGIAIGLRVAPMQLTIAVTAGWIMGPLLTFTWCLLYAQHRANREAKGREDTSPRGPAGRPIMVVIATALAALALAWVLEFANGAVSTQAVATAAALAIGICGGYLMCWNLFFGPFPGGKALAVQFAILAGLIAAMPLASPELIILSVVIWMAIPLMAFMFLVLWKFRGELRSSDSG